MWFPMIDFLAKAGIVLLAFTLAVPTLAQSDAPGAPVQLPGAEEEEAPAGGSVPSVSSGTLIVPRRAGAEDLGIEVAVIGQAAEPIGVLGENEGGFGPALWAETSPTTVQILLNQIPVAAPSTTMASLTRRLLLSAAEPTADPSVADDILVLRIRRAFDAGLTDAVPALIDQADHLAGDETLEAVRARAMLLSGDGIAACGSATTMRLESEELFWMKLRAYCYAKQGFAPAARLTADLLYDLGDQDELFQTLLDRLAGNSLADPGGHFDQPLDELHIAMLRDTGYVPPADRIAAASLPALRAIARADNWTGDDGVTMRLSAAEEAAWGRALTPDALLSIYMSATSIDPATRGAALNAASSQDELLARATFAAALRIGGAPAEQAQIVTAAFDAATDASIEDIYAAALGRAINAVAVQDSLAWAGADMSLAALASGNIEDAADWYDLVRINNSARIGRQQSLQAALIVARPSERFAYWPEMSLNWLSQSDLGEFPHVRLAEQLIIFDALGIASDPVVIDRLGFNEVEIDGYLPPAAVLNNLARAAEAGRLGETVATALVVVGPSGPRGAHPRGLAAVIEALRVIGLDAEARALATEALVGFALDARTDPEPGDLP